MGESKEAYLLRSNDVAGLLIDLNFFLARIADRLDALEGHRDRPTFYQNPKLEAGTASRMVKTDADKILESQYQVAAPATLSDSNNVTGSDTVDLSALNILLNNITQYINTINGNLQGAEILVPGTVAEPSEDAEVTFGGEETTFGGEEVAW